MSDPGTLTKMDVVMKIEQLGNALKSMAIGSLPAQPAPPTLSQFEALAMIDESVAGLKALIFASTLPD